MKKFEDEYDRDMKLFRRVAFASVILAVAFMAVAGWAVVKIVTWLVTK